MIAIVNYGLGNLRSVLGAVNKVGYEGVITNDAGILKKADKIILPGVGAFGEGMSNIRSMKLIPVLDEIVLNDNKPILGICLGFQLLALSSEEFGYHEGLGWINGHVKMLNAGNLLLPHVGWNDLFKTDDCFLFDDIPDDALFYHVHSFILNPGEDQIVIGESEYGLRFPTVIRKGNIYGVQFHPEKSQKWGLVLLKNFLDKAQNQ